MQAVVPVDIQPKRKTEPQPSTVKISYNNTCQTCFNETGNLRQLPCQHEFCKDCLKTHIEAFDELQSTFLCPVCRKSIRVPKGSSKDKLMQSFKTESRSVFYDTRADPMLRAVSFNDALTFRNPNHVTKRNTSGISRHRPGTRRTALCITGSLLDHIHGFRIRAQDDLNPCMAWGVDCFPNGDIVVADWNNSSLKLYSKDGIFMSKLKIPHKPLGVCALDDTAALVSIGSRERLLYLLRVRNGDLYPDRIFPLKGYLYDISKYKDRCIGIYQIDDNVIELVRVTRDGKATLKCVDKGSLSVFSHSGVCFKSRPSPKIYFTSDDQLVCLDTNGSLVFKKSYTFKEQDNTKNYSLGAICLDSSDGLFIASDFCVLHVDKNCDLINVMPTKIDPFAITALNDGVTLVIMGRNKTAETYRVQYGIQ